MSFTIPDFAQVPLPPAAARPARRPQRVGGCRRRRRPASTSTSRSGRPPRASTSRRCTPRPTVDGLDFLDTYPGHRCRSSAARTRRCTSTSRGRSASTPGFSTAEDSNAFYRRNLAAGQKGLSVAFDLPTHRGYDSDHPRVAGDVGMAGVAIDSIYDMRALFDGIPLDQMSVSMTMNGAVLPILALYIVAAEEQGVPPEQLAGTIQNDILKEFMVRNTYIYPPSPSMRIISDIFGYTSTQHAAVQLDLDLRLPHAGGRGDGRPRAGLHAGRRRRVLCGGHRRRPRRRPFAPRLSFFWAIGMNFFMEVAKLRAARLLWAKLSRSSSPRGTRSRCRCAPTPRPRAGRSPRRTCTTTWCAPASRRWPPPRATPRGCTPTPSTRRWRCRPTSRPASPATPSCSSSRSRAPPTSSTRGAAATTSSGSPPSSARKALDHIGEVEELGGMAKAIEAGIPKLRIEEAAARTQARIDSGRQPVIGVNKYRLDSNEDDRRAEGRQRGGPRRPAREARAAPGRARRQDEVDRGARRPHQRRRVGRRQPARARCRRRPGQGDRRRDQRRAREGVRSAPRRDPIDLGGVPQRDGRSGRRRGARCGARSSAFEAADGRRPRILLAKMGQDGHDRGQKVIATGFADLGLDVDIGPLFQTPAEAARQAVEADVHVVGASSLAAGHLTLVPELRDELADAGRPDIMIVVGGVIPPQDYDELLRGRRRGGVPARHRHPRGGVGPAGPARGAARLRVCPDPSTASVGSIGSEK